MDRFLVAFEAPNGLTDETYEEAWDRWVTRLHHLNLQLVDDITPVEVVLSIEVYEAVPLP